MRRIFKAGSSLVVALPRDVLESLGLSEGASVSVELDRESGRIVIAPIDNPPPGVDKILASQVADFIDRYRSALEELAG